MSVRLALLYSATSKVSEDRDGVEGSWRHKHYIYRGRWMRVESIRGLFNIYSVSCMCKQVLSICK